MNWKIRWGLLWAFGLVACGAPFSGSNAADLGSSGLVCADGDPTGDITPDSGSNRKFIVIKVHQNNTDPAPTLTFDGVSATGANGELFDFLYSSAASPDQHAFYWGLNETGIAATSGAITLSYSDAVGSFTNSWCYATIVNTVQTDVTTWDDTSTDASAAVSQTVTSAGAGDLTIIAWQHDLSATDGLSWESFTEVYEDNADDTNYQAAYAYLSGAHADGTETLTWTGSSDDNSAVSVFFDDAPSIPVWTSGPTHAAATNGVQTSGTVTSGTAITVYTTVCLPALGNATASEIEAETCTGSVADLYSGNDTTWASGVGDNFTITDPGQSLIRVKACTHASNTSGDSAVTCTVLNRSPDSGEEFDGNTPWTALSGTSPWTLQSVATCDCTTGSDTLTNCNTGENDWMLPGQRVDITATTCFADQTDIVAIAIPSSTSIQVDQDATGTVVGTVTVTQFNEFSATPVNGDALEGDSTNSATDPMTYTQGDVICDAPCSSTPSYWTVGYDLQDASVTTGDGWLCEGCTLHVGGAPPAFSEVIPLGPTITVGIPYAFQMGTSESHQSNCTDPDSQTVTYSVRETLAGGGTVTYSTGGVLAYDGMSFTEDEAGTTYTFDCNDSGRLGATPYRLTLHLIDTWTVGAYTGMTLSAALAAIESDAPWRQHDNPYTTPGCNPNGNVASQSPTASSEAAAYVTFTLTLDNGGLCTVRRRR